MKYRSVTLYKKKNCRTTYSRKKRGGGRNIKGGEGKPNDHCTATKQRLRGECGVCLGGVFVAVYLGGWGGDLVCLGGNKGGGIKELGNIGA